ncbi:delta serrate ligand [Dictyocaulus viviparus]|uniref:Delta-like protein n=1 Tax=Dictyocaulus viviparus TaxID=29172 RepID=A0A0D8Y0J5_DICVI|nr:delta serrate ligand [Dictyocaulus viviparus]
MLLLKLIVLITLHLITNANLFNSGTFMIRFSSMKSLQIRYCFTELPYHYPGTSDTECLKSGYMKVMNHTETILELRLSNITSDHMTVAFNISDRNEGERPNEDQLKNLSYRVVIDGSLPTQRIAVTTGLIIDFSTICNRPFYGLMCAQYCVDEVDDHHVCDRNGKKVCLSGWTGSDCTTPLLSLMLSNRLIQFEVDLPTCS